jgi:hypothetical protein
VKVDEIRSETIQRGKFKILFAFAKPESGRSLLKLANGLTRKLPDNAVITAMHLSPSNELHHYTIDEYERENFTPVIEESNLLNQKVTTFFKTTDDIENEITEAANKGDYDLLLIGQGQSIYEGSLLGRVLGFTTRIINPERFFDNVPFDDRTKSILGKAQIPVGIFIDRNFKSAGTVFLPIFDPGEGYLITYAQKLIHNSNAQVIVFDAMGYIKNSAELKEKIRAIEQGAPNHITMQSQRVIDKDFLKQQDLMIISMDSWKKLIEDKKLWLSAAPSTLIVAE